MKKLIIAAAVAAGLSSTAFAADLDTDVVDPVFGWGGFYAGAHIGFGKADFDGLYDNQDGAGAFNFGSLNNRGFIGGVQAGYNWQQGRFVFGIEADISAGNLDDDGLSPEPAGRGPDPVSVEIDLLASIRARAGLANDDMFFYGTAGVAFANYDVKITDVFSATTGTDSHSDVGFVVGAGVEYALDSNWTVKAEYLFHRFNKEHVLEPATFSDADVGDSVGLGNIHTVKIGLNYKF